MAKVITTVGACSTKGKLLGMQFLVGGGESALAGSFTLMAESPIVSSESLTGTPVVGPNFSKIGCKFCGNKFVYQCGACKKFVCYDGREKKNFPCPACGSRGDVPASKDKRIPRGSSMLSPYTQWASTSDIPAVKKDKYGNPQGAEYDLAKDGAFTKYTIVVLGMCHDLSYNFSKPAEALKRKGFEIVNFEKVVPTLRELENALSLPNVQLWVVADSIAKLSDDYVRLIKRFYEEGHGLYLWSDNDPYYVDTNKILNAIFGSSVYMSGNYIGEKVLTIQPRMGEPGIIANHPISTGIANFYEGITISHVNGYAGVLVPLVYSSDRQVVTAFGDRDGKRVLVDGGFTRLFYRWDSAGTDRYIVNAAAWLANIERFGYRG